MITITIVIEERKTAESLGVSIDIKTAHAESTQIEAIHAKAATLFITKGMQQMVSELSEKKDLSIGLTQRSNSRDL